jgi:hypothetical protein
MRLKTFIGPDSVLSPAAPAVPLYRTSQGRGGKIGREKIVDRYGRHNQVYQRPFGLSTSYISL